MTEFAALERLFLSVLHLSLAAAVVIPIALTVRSLLGSRRDPRLFHLLWIALAARMLVPWSPPIASGWRIAMPAPSPALSGSGQRPAGHAPAPRLSAETDGLAGGASAVDWLTAAGAIWLAGAAAVAVFVMAAHLRFRAAVLAGAKPAGGDLRPLRDILDECRDELGIRTTVGLRITSHLTTPAVHGLVKPVILIPRSLVGHLDREAWTCVIAHELIHIRRRDALWNALMTAFAVAHWFNPLAWIACRAMREDQEHACDAALARRMPPVRYGRALARVAELQQPAVRGAAIPFLSGRSNLTRRRMEMLFARKRTAFTAIAVFCLLAASAVMASAARDPQAGPASSGAEISFIAPVYGTIVWKFGEPKKHNVHAISIAAEPGTPVYAAADGVVTQAGYAEGDGNRIAVAHAEGYESVYNHLLDILVAEGEQVKRGDLIGTVGSTGNSTGPQLSFELLREGEFIDPESVIAFDMPRREP
jgi:bla regulator protein BlaR1